MRGTRISSRILRSLRTRRSVTEPDSKLVAIRDAVYAYGTHRELAFRVPLEKCCTYLAFSFASSGWHPFTATVRQIIDDLEGLVAEDLWPLPTYSEMLFVK
jgi:hypothetical protein